MKQQFRPYRELCSERAMFGKVANVVARCPHVLELLIAQLFQRCNRSDVIWQTYDMNVIHTQLQRLLTDKRGRPLFSRNGIVEARLDLALPQVKGQCTQQRSPPRMAAQQFIAEDALCLYGDNEQAAHTNARYQSLLHVLARQPTVLSQ